MMEKEWAEKWQQPLFSQCSGSGTFSVLDYSSNSTVSKGSMHLDKLCDPSFFVCEKSVIIPFDES